MLRNCGAYRGERGATNAKLASPGNEPPHGVDMRSSGRAAAVLRGDVGSVHAVALLTTCKRRAGCARRLTITWLPHSLCHVATQEMGVAHPTAADSDYAIWQAFANPYWSALNFVDAQGHIRHHHFGEDQHEESERVNNCCWLRPEMTTSVRNWCRSTHVVSKQLPNGATYGRPRTTSAMNAPRTLPLSKE